MQENRNPPQSTAELAYGRDADQIRDDSPDRIAPVTEHTSSQEEREAEERITQERPARIEERPREVTDTSIEHAPLLDESRSGDYTNRWQTIQAKFVEEPQDAVREADGLVAEVIQALAASFAEQRQQLEGKWGSGGDVTTEDLRQALIQYRSFFQRLLAA